MNTLEQVHDYWLHPEPKNAPGQYAHKEAYWVVVEMARKYIEMSNSILELGCNIGLNLHRLSLAGYKNLSAIEINPQAVRAMRKTFPNLQARIYNNSIEQVINKLGDYDLIFSKAVLCHIHPDSDWVFEQIAKRANYIFTFEDEVSNGSRHCARNYREVFEPFGFEQLEEMSNIRGLSAGYRGRVFQKLEKYL